VATGLFVAVAAFAVGPTEAAFARTWAGKVEMNELCIVQSGFDWHAERKGDSAFDWYCYNDHTRKSAEMDINWYCDWKYGGAYADPQGGGAYDWGCYWA